jgi:hypothetical protein
VTWAEVHTFSERRCCYFLTTVILFSWRAKVKSGAAGSSSCTNCRLSPPAFGRVWRKLKAAGAVYLQNGVAALPADAAGERAMRGAAQEVREFGGIAHLLRGEAVGDEAALVGAFGEARDAEYAELLSKCRDFHAELEKERAAGKFTFAELEENEEDLNKLEAWLRKVELRDRFGAPLAQEASAAVLACREDLEAFAASVYEAADHGSAGSPPSGP